MDRAQIHSGSSRICPGHVSFQRIPYDTGRHRDLMARCAGTGRWTDLDRFLAALGGGILARNELKPHQEGPRCQPLVSLVLFEQKGYTRRQVVRGCQIQQFLGHTFSGFERA